MKRRKIARRKPAGKRRHVATGLGYGSPPPADIAVLGEIHPTALAFAKENEALGFRQFWRKWFTRTDVRAHLATMMMQPTRAGLSALMEVQGHVHPAPQRVAAGAEDQASLEITLRVGGTEPLRLGYQPRGYIAGAGGQIVDLVAPPAGGNGHSNGGGAG